MWFWWWIRLVRSSFCENLLVFSVDFEDNEEVALYLKEELEDIVHILNGQDNLIEGYIESIDDLKKENIKKI